MKEYDFISFSDYHSMKELTLPNFYISFIVCILCIIVIFFVLFFLPLEKKYLVSFVKEESLYRTYIPIELADNFKSQSMLLIDGKKYVYQIISIHSDYLYQDNSILVVFDFVLDSSFDERFIYKGSICVSNDTLVELFVKKLKGVLYE
ncbi:MAG: hypothetical protein E7168_02240 [Firmicutes bacterium]|nr:hypothetical protein [Bacillota bacterium]